MGDRSEPGPFRAAIDAMEKKRAEAAAKASAHSGTYHGISPIRVNKLGHMVYEVSDLERSVRFWTEVLGFIESERNEFGMVFLRCGGDHHGIGLKQSDAVTRALDGLKFHHLAMEVDCIEDLFRARDYLRKNDIPIMFEGRFGAGSNVGINFLDPDGFEFEIYCTIDQINQSGRVRPKSAQRRASSLEEARETPLPENGREDQ